MAHHLVYGGDLATHWCLVVNVGSPASGRRGGDATDGSLVDRLFFGVLTGVGLWILSRRRFDWGIALRMNPWLTAIIAFMALSILWSQFPFVSFKRFVKMIGSVVMAMVVLTEENPREAFLTVIRRCFYVHLPMSIICIKYFRDIGVEWGWNGSVTMWSGISTSKNVLGQVALLGALYFFWEVRKRWAELRWRNLHLLYLLMTVYLLKGSDNSVSLTSVSVCVFALTVFLRLQSLRFRPDLVPRFVKIVFYSVTALVVLVLVHSVVLFSADSFFGHIITAFGRDITLTDRTYIWHDCYAAVGNPLLGVGFGAFWIGRLANIPWNAHMTWVLGQSHNGYIETYLQLGLIGGGLLAGVMFSARPKLLASLTDDFDFGCFRVTLFLTLLLINITESTYIRGDHHLWLILMIITWAVPSAHQTAPISQTADNWSTEEQAEDQICETKNAWCRV